MAKKKTMVEMLRDQVETATGKVAEAQAKADLWNSRLIDAQQELDRLQNSLAALEGTAPPKKVYHEIKIPEATAIRTNASRTAHDEMLPESRPVAVNPRRVMFNGVEIDLEEGFHVEKNSFGEDALVPDGMRITPMEEPTEVRKPDFSLPAIGSGDGFSDPKDLF